MAAKQHHDLLIIAGVGGAGYVAWKLWEHFQGGATDDLGFGSLFTPSLPSVSAPTIVGGGAAPGGVQGSIVDARVSPGGDVGAAMWKKNWTQTQAKARLDAIKQGVANSMQAIAALKANTANPNASGIAAAQQQLAQEQSAMQTALARAQSDAAAGDTAGANNWASAANAHQQDIAELTARIQAASQNVDNSAAIAQYEGAIAALKADYFALTGMQLS